MVRSEPTGWIGNAAGAIGRRAIWLGRWLAGPELHVTLVIARAANQARRRRSLGAAGHFPLRTER
uniref:Uncharacterized protein n=1 Tax=Bradyrhizobium amphicarpaeae TaxID=1404768 RepID=A0A2U8PMJ9_9BRAD|nr:hypothetical protein CIT40_00810 [Bradyrhizobium amphicarpaeae]